MKVRNDLTAEYVRSILDYNPETGIFLWKERPLEDFKTEGAWKSWNSQYPNTEAGAKSLHYTKISIKKRLYLAQRIAWLHYYGEWPQDIVDHKNRDKSDNLSLIHI